MVTSNAVSRKAIKLASLAASDCKNHGIDPDALVSFIFAEASRHPKLFEVPFSSVPLVFGEFVILVSWSGAHALIERVLTRFEAYPLNDLWSSCLAVYRKATLLPYRSQDPQKLISATEGRRSLTEFQRLISTLEKFLLANSEGGQAVTIADLENLLSEAEFALTNGDIGIAVSRLEAVLSIAHKIILYSAPSGMPGSPGLLEPYSGLRTPEASSIPSILCVDDEIGMLHLFAKFLSMEGFDVVTANTPAAALKALVERDFAVVITDLVMGVGSSGLQMDGREVAIAAKKSNPKTKVIIVTGFFQMSMLADLMHLGIDAVLSKPQAPKDLINRIRTLTDLPLLDQGNEIKAAERKAEAKKHIFMSYCKENIAAVRSLREDLLGADECVWWDQDILPGQDWRFEIRRAMQEAYAIVICLSRESSDRTVSGIYPEAADAIVAYREYAPGSIFLIPVRLSQCRIPPVEIDGVRTLDRLQYVDLFPSTERQMGITRLLQAVRAAPQHPGKRN